MEVRILGGRWRRTPLAVPVVAGLRPTPARVRETLFNWLGQDLSGWRVLDAFAGSGALGLEAASRGAEQVCLLERHPLLVRGLEATVSKLAAQAVRVVATDALAWMRSFALSQLQAITPVPGAAAAFDLVLLDPPFDDAPWQLCLGLGSACLPVGGWLYVEAPMALEPELVVDLQAQALTPAGGAHTPALTGVPVQVLRQHRQGRAGAVHFHLYRKLAPGHDGGGGTGASLTL